MSELQPSVVRLIDEARAGRSGAMDRLLARYRRYLHFLARTGLESTLRAKADASDVVQETFLLACRNIRRFRGTTEAELTAWLRRILARCLAMLVRRYRATAARDVHRERAIWARLDDSSRAMGDLLPSPQVSPSVDAVARERSVILAQALAGLSEDHRRVVELRSLRQLSWEAVGQAMDRSADAARKLWTRAIRGLGEAIEGRQL